MEHLLQQELQDEVSEAIKDLSPKLGRAVVLYYLRGLPHADIVNELQAIEGTTITEGGSKTRVHRVRKALREQHPLKHLYDRF